MVENTVLWDGRGQFNCVADWNAALLNKKRKLPIRYIMRNVPRRDKRVEGPLNWVRATGRMTKTSKGKEMMAAEHFTFILFTGGGDLKMAIVNITHRGQLKRRLQDGGPILSGEGSAHRVVGHATWRTPWKKEQLWEEGCEEEDN